MQIQFNLKSDVLPTISIIANSVCKVLDIPIEEVRSRCKEQEIKDARHICIYCCYLYTSNNIKFIGKYFQRHRTTAISSLIFCERDSKVQKTLKKIIPIIFGELPKERKYYKTNIFDKHNI